MGGHARKSETLVDLDELVEEGERYRTAAQRNVQNPR